LDMIFEEDRTIDIHKATRVFLGFFFPTVPWIGVYDEINEDNDNWCAPIGN